MDQLRVLEEEKRELDEMRIKLGALLSTRLYESLDKGEQDRLSKQYNIMTMYSQVLGERIDQILIQKENNGSP